jgi:tetratricopeptide (TPR) repeat protein
MQSEVLLELLEQRNYAELERRLGALQIGFEQGEISDIDYFQQMPVHVPTRRDLLAHYAQWREGFPHSFVAHALSAMAEVDLAWLSRSDAISRHVTKSRWVGMKQHFAQAQAHLAQAMTLSTKPHFALVSGMQMQTADCERAEDAIDWSAQVERLLPQSPSLCRQWLWRLNPKWGGSEDALTAFRNDARTWFNDQDFALVEASYLGERADIQRWQGKFAGAETYFAASEKILGRESHAVDRAYCLAELKQEARAVAILQHAVDTNPSPRNLRQLAWQLEDLIDQKHVPSTPARWEEIFALHARAARLGDGNAAAHCMRLIRKLGVNAGNWQLLQSYFQLGTQQYSASAYFQMGSIFYDGEGVPKQAQIALQYWKEASILGHSDAAENVTMVLWDGRDGVLRDYAGALYFAELGAQVDSAYCTGALGRMYLRGHGTDIDREHGAALVENAANEKDQEAIVEWIRCLHFGRGVAKDPQLAAHWLAVLEQMNPEEANALRKELGSLFSRVKGLFNR